MEQKQRLSSLYSFRGLTMLLLTAQGVCLYASLNNQNMDASPQDLL